MPQHGEEDLAPEDAIARGLCPECARDLARTNIEEHIADHWPGERSPEAERRISMLRKHDSEVKSKPEVRG